MKKKAREVFEAYKEGDIEPELQTSITRYPSLCLEYGIKSEKLRILNLSQKEYYFIENDWNKIKLFPNLEVINIMPEQFQFFPLLITHITKLKGLAANHCGFSHFPQEISCLINLEIISFINNQLQEFPPQIRNLKKLKHFILIDNPIAQVAKQKLKILLPNTKIDF